MPGDGKLERQLRLLRFCGQQKCQLKEVKTEFSIV